MKFSQKMCLRLSILLAGAVFADSLYGAENDGICRDSLIRTEASLAQHEYRVDHFFHVEIEDRVWAQTILPRVAFAPFNPNAPLESNRVSFGNSLFPEIMIRGEYVTYFDNFEFDRVEGNRNSGRLVYCLNSGISFELLFQKRSLRRRFELIVHGLSGPRSSKTILSLKSGIEMSI